jgi:glycosyltransferase involved in cell wall biosynthesis
MNAALVTVVIPCYNQARYLGEAIESVLDQSYSNIETVVVDDGSSEDCKSVAQKYEGVRYVRQERRGLSGARNRGMEESEGEYVVFLDADDRLMREGVEEGVRSLEAHPECAFVYGHVRLISGDGSPLLSPEQVSVKAEHYLELLRHNYIWSPGAVMYRRSVVEAAGGFDTSINPSADFDLNIRIAGRYPIFCHDKTVLEYRRHSENMTRDFALMLKASLDARRSHRRYVKGNREYEVALESGIRSVQWDYGEKLIKAVRAQLRRREWRRAATGLLALLRYYPRGLARHAFGLNR